MEKQMREAGSDRGSMEGGTPVGKAGIEGGDMRDEDNGPDGDRDARKQTGREVSARRRNHLGLDPLVLPVGYKLYKSYYT